MRTPAVFLVGLILASSPAAYASDCEAPAGMNSHEMNLLLHQRAADLLARAAAEGWSSDQTLTLMVAPNAEFSLGAGDVGRSMPAGLAGAHQLALTAHADGYRYRVRNGPPRPASACGPQKLTIEFYDTETRQSSEIEFVFDDLVLMSAKGWQHYIEPIAMPSVEP